MGVSVPAACRAGACHACLLRAAAGDPGAAGQRGLKPPLAARGYFLACLTRPATDLAVGSGTGAAVPARLVARNWLGPGVLGIWVRPRRPFRFLAGQHVTLDRGDGVVRAYSIANLPQEAARDGLEFHVRVYPGGAMSEWLAGAAPGNTGKRSRVSGWRKNRSEKKNSGMASPCIATRAKESLSRWPSNARSPSMARQ